MKVVAVNGGKREETAWLLTLIFALYLSLASPTMNLIIDVHAKEPCVLFTVK